MMQTQPLLTPRLASAMAGLLTVTAEQILRQPEGSLQGRYPKSIDRDSPLGKSVYDGLLGEMTSWITLMGALAETATMRDAAIRLCDDTIGRIALYRMMMGNTDRSEFALSIDYIRTIKLGLEMERDRSNALG